MSYRPGKKFYPDVNLVVESNSVMFKALELILRAVLAKLRINFETVKIKFNNSSNK